MNFLSLFSGIGGFDLGLEMAGMTCVGQVEIDPYCRRVLAKHWPHVPRFEDVKTTTRQSLVQCGTIDLIAGGFPCQDISGAGKRSGINGSRSGLWTEFHRLICEIRPRYVIVENVSALLVPGYDESGKWYPAPISRVLGDLAKVGYDAEWDMLSTAMFGAAHLRNRVFIVAYPYTEGMEGCRRGVLAGEIGPGGGALPVVYAGKGYDLGRYPIWTG